MDLFKEEIKVQKIMIKEKNQTVPLYYCQTTKFKTFYLYCNFLFNYNKDTRNIQLALSSLLDKSTSVHPNENQFIDYLYNSYDMLHEVAFNQYGLIDYLTFRVGTINSKYVHENVDLLKTAADLLKETIFYPNFNNEYLEEIKDTVIANIENKKNNQVTVAYDKFFTTMFKGELIATKTTNDPEVIRKITMNDVKNAYDELLSCPHYYCYIGEDSLDDVIPLLSDIDLPMSKKSTFNAIEENNKVIEEVHNLIEDYNVNQSNIFMGYRTPINTLHDDYYAIHTLNIMLGGSGFSDLFKIVREEHGLAYSISSNYSPTKGYIIVNAGISKVNYEKTYKLVTEIINNYKKGNISEELLEITKKTIISSVRNGLDYFSSTANNAFNDFIFDSFRTAKEKISLVEKITVEDIKRVANTLVLDTTYFMKGEK